MSPDEGPVPRQDFAALAAVEIAYALLGDLVL